MKLSKKRVIIATATVLTVAVAFVLLILLTPKQSGRMIIPWNPGTTTDVIIREFVSKTNLEPEIENIAGTNGAVGVNEVFDSASQSGNTVLGTNLSSFVTTKAMSFSEYGVNDCEVIVLAQSPVIIAVAANGREQSLSDLLSVSGRKALAAANSGIGTMSYVSSHLFADAALISAELEHKEYPGSNAAINAVINGEADFVATTANELMPWLRSGELRALTVFRNDAVSFSGVGEIPPVTDTISDFNALFPVSESYGVIFPRGVKKNMPENYKAQLSEVEWAVFADENGLLPPEANISDMDYAREMENIISQALERALSS
jgi:tripartite-type tricarboxylate transporter receptor subunit TctC